jgi:Protein of unknown function DUF262
MATAPTTRDIEGDEFEDLVDVPEPLEFWKKKQREIVTSVVDYNLSTLADLVEDSAIDANPAYQRRNRWDDERSSKLIESFLMNVPVPPVFLNEGEFGHYSIIDGKQRLTAITNFLKGRLRLTGLSVFSDVNDMTIADLPAGLRSIIKTRPTLRAVIILPQSDQDIKFEVFQRLNTGGVRLNAQEIRNSAFTGPLNDLILELSADKDFHRMLGIKRRDTSAIYREMRDAEFVLRYFTFRTTWKTFSGGMKRNMDSFMANNRNMPEAQLTAFARDFRRTLKAVEAVFGENCFRRWVPEKKMWRKQVLAAIFDAQMFACSRLDPASAATVSQKIVSEFKKLFSDDAFRGSIDAATNTPNLFKYRIRALQDLVQQ